MPEQSERSRFAKTLRKLSIGSRRRQEEEDARELFRMAALLGVLTMHADDLVAFVKDVARVYADVAKKIEAEGTADDAD